MYALQTFPTPRPAGASAFAAGVSGARRCATEPYGVPPWNGNISLLAESDVDIVLPGCRASTAAMSAHAVLEIGVLVKVSLSAVVSQ